ncbi:MAG TPA: hypothetical protein VFA26_16730, partial [Gemmataceae bacterium]|nr:hypothetical protein [Gemmataceae bacterium]
MSAAAPRPPLPAAAPPRPAAATAPAWGPIWEDFYRSATPAQQSALMTLACRQGVLYAHQLPPVPSPADRGRQFLTRLLNGQTEDLAPVRPAPVEVEDAELDAGQREAVARALGTPDLCLLQGLPGTGKSRVVA